MIDPRIERMAKVLVHHSLNIQPGDHLGIRSSPLASPLLYAIAREALHVGGYPEVFVHLPDVQELLLREGSVDQLAAMVPSDWRMVVNEFDALLEIQAAGNSKSLSTIAPERKALQNQAYSEVLRTFMQRSTRGDLRWTMTLFPTNAYAQDTNLSLGEFEELFYRACFLDEDDPINCWRQLSQQQESHISRLNGKRTIQLKGPATDLTFSIQGRIFLNEDGRYNFPGGEFFTGPVENSVNGSILFNVPSIYGGQEVKQVRIRFEEGRVVEAQAQQGQDYLERMLCLDDGARYLGEFAFGNNPFIQQYTRNILFDEKMKGTIHLALGASIPATRGMNQSSLHWDMVFDLKTGSEVYVDEELFCKDGCFVL